MTSGGAVPVTDLDPASPPPRTRKRSRMAIGAIGVVAVLVVGGFAAVALRGNAGGASSPEEAVRQLADAINNEDVLAAVDVLAPSEVQDLRETVDTARQRAADLEIVKSSSQPFAGIDLSVDNLQLSVDEIVDGYAKVTMAGTIHADVNRSGLSPYVRDTLGAKSASGDFDLSGMSINGNKPFVMAVRSGGNWYVSPAYTAFESMRLAQNLPGADLGSAVQTRGLGAATPDDAVQQMMRAIQARDWQKVASLADPEGFPMYDYRAAFTKLMNDNTDPQFTIDKLTTKSTANGDRAAVTLDAGGQYGTDGSSWSITNGCLGSDAIRSGLENDGSNPALCLGSFGGGVLGIGAGSSNASPPVEIATVRRAGRWFVAPSTTAFDAVRTWLPQIDKRMLATLTNNPLEIPVDGQLTLDTPQTLAATGALRPEHYTLTVTEPVSVIPVVAANEQSVGTASIYKGTDQLFPRGTDAAIELTPGTYDVIAVAFGPPSSQVTVFKADTAPEWAKNGGYGAFGGAVDCFATDANGQPAASSSCPPLPSTTVVTANP